MNGASHSASRDAALALTVPRVLHRQKQNKIEDRVEADLKR